jgi:Putative zinc-finger
MEHQNAQETMAAERYLLNEMSEEENAAFEEHLFDCQECAADIRAGAAMMEAGREVAREAPVVQFKPKPSPTWFPRAAAAAIVTALLSGAMGWYGALRLAVPRMATVDTGIGDAHEFKLGDERGPGDALHLPANRPNAVIFLIPPADELPESYVFRVRSKDGRIDLSKPVSLEEAEEPVTKMLPALPRGSYDVVVEGVRKNGNRFPVTSNLLTVEER